jgi:diadenosine tetraphosphate (Ap4A) HIT family hydrolase
MGTTNSDCIFCNLNKIKSSLFERKCDRTIIDNKYALALLCPEQYTPGHTVVIFKKHIENITCDIRPLELHEYIKAIHKVARLLKRNAVNYNNDKPENVYVCILSDGIKHLHAHAIPRYPFTGYDEAVFRDTFIRRDGIAIDVCNAIEASLKSRYYYA